MKKNDFINVKANKVEFLDFDIKILKRNDLNVVETRKTLSFKKMRNRLTSQRDAMEARFEKTILRFYETQKLRLLKALICDKKVKITRKKAIDLLAHKDAYELLDQIELKGKKWISNQQFFENWVQKEFIQLRSSWIQENELKEFGYGKVIDAYNNLLSVMKNVISYKDFAKIKSEKVKRIKVNSNYKKMHLD